jgi:hypothetical protein
MRVFRDRRPMPTRLEMTFLESWGAVQYAKAYRDNGPNRS